MRSILICTVMIIILVPAMTSAIDWEKGALDIYLSSEGYYHDIAGNEDRSSLEDGWFYVENLILDFNQELAKKAQFQGYAHVRSSNDSQHQIDGRDWMFVEGYARLADDLNAPDIYEVWAGDYAESYTPYTLNTYLLGTKAFYKYNDWVKVSALYGRNRDEGLDHYVSNTGGGRVEFYYKNYLTVGATFVYTDVERDSLRSDSPVGDQLNQVFGGDLHLSLWGDRIHFDAEYARSIYNDDERDETLRDQYDNAYLVRGDISPADNLTVSAEFERVEPWFNTVLGAASPDMERVKGQIDYAPWYWLTMMLLHEYSFDKLDDHSLVEHRTYTHLTSFSSSVYPFYQREDAWNSLTVNLQIDHSTYYTKDHPRTTDSDDLMVNLSLSQSFTHWNYSLGYTYSRNWNRVDRTSEYFSHVPSVNIGITYPWLALDWTWTGYGSYEYRDYTLPGLRDQIYSGGVGLSLGYERTRSTLNLNVSVEYYDNASDPVLGTPDNISRTYSAVFDQVLWEREYLTANLSLSVSYRDYDEHAHDGDYTEGVYYGGLTVTF